MAPKILPDGDKMFGWFRTNKSLRREVAYLRQSNKGLRQSVDRWQEAYTRLTGMMDRTTRELAANNETMKKVRDGLDDITGVHKVPPCSAHALEPDRHAKQWAKASRGRSVTATLPTEPEKRASGHGTGSGDTLASPLAVVLAGAAVAAAITSSSADASPAPASDSFVSGGGDFGGGGSSGSFE